MSNDYTTYVLDVPGWGVNDGPSLNNLSSSDCIELHIQVLLQFMDTLLIDKAIVLAHSVGGFFAIHFAANHPGRVEKLVLMNPAGIFTTLGDSGAYWALLFKTGLHNRILRMLRPILSAISMSTIVRFQFMLLSSHMPNIGLLTKFITLTPYLSGWRNPCLSVFVRLNVPTALIYGSNDSLIPLHQGCFLSFLSHNRLPCVAVMGAGHAPHALLPAFLPALQLALNTAVRPLEVYESSHAVTQRCVTTFSRYHTRHKVFEMYKEIAVDFGVNEPASYAEIENLATTMF
jgi:pimeloyl-ACP methyl ester carboxylesterase